MLEILQACKLDHEVAIKCTRNRHIGSATNPPDTQAPQPTRQHNFFLVRQRQMSYDVARLSLMVSIDPCQILPLILVQQLSVRQKLRIQEQEQQQPIMDFENGVIVKIYKSQVDPILVGGRLRRPQTKMGISSGPMTLILSKPNPNSTQLNSTQSSSKKLGLRLDIVATCSPPPYCRSVLTILPQCTAPQTFKQLLDQLES